MKETSLYARQWISRNQLLTLYPEICTSDYSEQMYPLQKVLAMEVKKPTSDKQFAAAYAAYWDAYDSLAWPRYVGIDYGYADKHVTVKHCDDCGYAHEETPNEKEQTNMAIETYSYTEMKKYREAVSAQRYAMRAIKPVLPQQPKVVNTLLSVTRSSFQEMLNDAVEKAYKERVAPNPAEVKKLPHKPLYTEAAIAAGMVGYNDIYAANASKRKAAALASLGGYTGLTQPTTQGLTNVVGSHINFKPERG